MRAINTIVTTAGRPDDESMALAAFACQTLGATFEPRKKRSVRKMSEAFQANIIVAGKNRYDYYAYGVEEPFFFHPNSAAFRLKRIARGEAEPFLEATQLQLGDTVLDCTLGLAADAMLAAYIVGETGRIVGLEANPNVAFIVGQGMQTYDTTELPLTACMRQIEVVQSEAVRYLKTLPANAFDVVYMDPMFEEAIEESNNFEALRRVGEHVTLTDEWVQEAKRVAKKRVVLKAHFRSEWFTKYHFQQYERVTAKFHYGVLEV
ncbi:class I SAM-dependent methyltransferase [Lysinibacillus fusiformis]|uniref:class I SAM-dependent methyltransferase n=1 Tax=Lysinibacillus fusiformis TaxID=28031 RepID=UPI001E65AB83|nr:class I SAM-dependent methyltransferase [Lysinibacillus fusiformis]MCE4042757.1 class I SAM-dependent methyltransferase [Lysinibacillus fusiformis]MDC6266538.1 class I SAM-dependent methyltransferase [Lysinibacillus sphaericus]MDN4970413.1 class I SAM-dependent methyltransferase [Lysinibacillus fusiformis]WEA41146.1 class I SAM-dependent methyltransferase [Lysinibacillus fusiformis]